jgi:hypothetical protein
MSRQNQDKGEWLRRRYAGHFGVPLKTVQLVEIEADHQFPERCVVQAPNLPAWTTCGPVPRWMEERALREGGDR